MTEKTSSSLELDDCDLRATASFLARVFGGTAVGFLTFFRHWWEHNPAWTQSLPKGWIVKSANGSIIAFTANIPFLYQINGADGISCATGSTAVDERWRGHGLSKLVGNRFLDQPSVDLLVGTGSTDLAYKLWLSLGMRPVQRPWPNASYCIPGSFTASIGNTRRNQITKRILCPVGAFGDIVYGIISSPPRATIRLPISEVDSFEPTDDPDLLACRASVASTFSLRNAVIMNWLYFGSSYIRASRVVLVAKSAQRIVGYIAMKRQSHSLLLLECRTIDADEEVAKNLFWAAQDYARRNDIAYIRVWRYSPMINSAVPRMCRIARLSPPMMTYCYKANRSFDEADWETTPGDGDQSVI